MSTHPNAILMLTLQPMDLPRKTYRAVLADAGLDPDDEDHSIKVGEDEFYLRLMEDRYDENWQISAPEGSIVAHKFLTYGYGDKLAWDKVAALKQAIEQWAGLVCEKHHCTVHEIAITANYW